MCKRSVGIYASALTRKVEDDYYLRNMACHIGLKRFSSFLAHLSQRLIGELIGYPWFGVRRPSTISNVFSSETAWPIKAKFYMEPPWEVGTKVNINSPGHMTKMTAMPIYGKNLKKSSSPEPGVL